VGRIIFIASILTTAVFGATVDGHVVNAVTGVGIPEVAVSLMQQEHLAYSATTDAEGRFQIAGVQAGTYTATYRAHSTLPVPNDFLPGSPPFSVDSGSPVHLDAKLPPPGKLSGRVLDLTGAPVPAAFIRLTLKRPNMSLTRQMPTDKNGEYHFDDLPVLAGWVLSATPPLYWKPPQSDDERPLGWAQVFYPGVTDPEAAAVLVLPPSGELFHLDITLTSVPVYRLRGVVLDPRGKAVPAVSVTLGSGFMVPRSVVTKDDGTFEFTSVTNGQSRLIVQSDRDTVNLRAERNIEMNGHDVDGVQVHLEEPFAIHGRVIVEVPDGSSPPHLSAVQIGNQRREPDSNGEFTAGDLYPGPYAILPEPAPAGYYLDSIRLGDTVPASIGVQLLSGSQTLTLTYKRGGGTVHGAVDSCDGGSVVLVPVDATLRLPGLIRQSSCLLEGKFEIPSVRPGQYYAFALPRGEHFGPFEDNDDDAIRQSTLVTVVDKETITAEVRLIKR
jgi:hypothetical protein